MSIYGVRDAILEATSVIAFTGAGISVPSGIPDFRSSEGIWARYPPEQFATLESFRDDPERWYGFHRALSRSFAAVEPNPAHEALAGLERLGALKAVITQNVDGLHQRAGNSRVVELHGTSGRMTCLACGAKRDGSPPLEGPPPTCDDCGFVLKPDVVLFGEELPPEALEASRGLARSADVCLVIGTSAVVYPAAELPHLTQAGGGTVCQFDLESTDLTHQGYVRWFVPGPAEGTLPRLLELVRAARAS